MLDRPGVRHLALVKRVRLVSVILGPRTKKLACRFLVQSFDMARLAAAADAARWRHGVSFQRLFVNL